VITIEQKRRTPPARRCSNGFDLTPGVEGGRGAIFRTLHQRQTADALNIQRDVDRPLAAQEHCQPPLAVSQGELRARRIDETAAVRGVDARGVALASWRRSDR
jgi:hypothetical protein